MSQNPSPAAGNHKDLLVRRSPAVLVTFTAREVPGINRSLPLMKFVNVLAVLILACVFARGQEEVRFTQGNVNNGTTLTLDVPLGNYKGRGLGLPVSINYSSSVWSIEHLKLVPASPAWRNVTEARFAKRSKAGWRSALDLPTVEFPKLSDVYSQQGKTPRSGPGCYVWRVARVYIHMPDGSTHELRKSDTPHNLGYVDTSGTFYAVDGSRLRYDSTDADTGTLYMPDGTRYVLDGGSGQIIDRHGNTLSYNGATRTWTDTIGRQIANPLPANPTVGEYQYSLPGLSGVNGGQLSYTFKWELLGDALTNPQDSLRYVASHYLPFPSSEPNSTTNFPQAQNSNAGHIFHDQYIYNPLESTWSAYTTFVVGKDQAGGATFNPVVLTEITLPNGSKYQFSYNSFGEIDKVVYPTNAYEQYEYESPEPPGGLAYIDEWVGAREPYVQAERRLNSHKVSANGTGSDLLQWDFDHVPQFGKTATTAPDGTRSEIYKKVVVTSGTEKFGFTDPREGAVVQRKAFSSTNAIVSRELLSHEQTSNTATLTGTCNSTSFSTSYTAHRNPRVNKSVSLLFEGSGPALGQVSTFSYDTTYALSTGLDQTGVNTYHFTVVSNSSPSDTAQLGTVDQISAGSLAKSTETAYLTSSIYRNANILDLPTSMVVKDGAGTIVSKSTISYDDSGYVPAGTSRGMPTTMSTWDSTKGVVTNSSAYLTTRAKFDLYGNQIETTDPRGLTTITAYDSTYNAFPVSITTPVPDNSGTYGSNVALTSSTSYDFVTGLVLSTTDANGQMTMMEYNDPLLRRTKVTAPNGHETVTEYGAGTSESTRWFKVSTEVDATNWKDAYTWYDGLGRTIKTQSEDSAGDVFVETEYDSMGRANRVTNPYRSGDTVSWTETTFDVSGRPWKITTPDNAVVETTYGLATTGGQIGSTLTVTDQAGKLRRSITNALGQRIRVDEPNDAGLLGAVNAPNQPTVYGYDVLNNLVSVTQGAQTRSFVYDSLGRLKQATNPESGTIDYAYDANGNLTQKIDDRNITTTYTYDALNRITLRDYSDTTPDVAYYYDNLMNAKGKLIKVSSSISTTEFTSFDTMGRVTGHRQTTDSTAYNTAYTYNLSGALIEETYPSGRKVKNTLDADGDLSLLETQPSGGSWQTRAGSFTYNAAGAVISMQLGNGRWESTLFNSRLQPYQIALGTTQNATDLLKLEYGYGTTTNNGNVVSQTITVPSGFTATQTYTYDSLNRLKSATETVSGSQTWKQTFTYDRYGNRNFDAANTTTLGSCPTAVCNPSFYVNENRFSSGQGYSYDAVGNITVDAEGRQFSYDAENKQTLVKNASNVTLGTYYYDGDGSRIKKSSATENIVFVYDAAGKLIEEYSGSTLQTAYVYAGGRLLATETSTGTNYLTNDHLGSPRINTNQSGAVTARHDYMPFGEEIFSYGGRTSGLGYTSDSVRKQFTGYERDQESELDFAQSRYFNSGVGRFSSPDAFTNDTLISNPQSWNLYVYVRNNPLNHIDPLGKKGTISWYTDSDGTIHVVLTASFAVYGAQGQNVSMADLEKYKNALIAGIKNHLTAKFKKLGGKNVEVTTNITASIVANEAEAVQLGSENRVDNIVEIGYGELETSERKPGVVGLGFGVRTENFDRMVLSVIANPDTPGVSSGDPIRSAGEAAAHEWAAHLLSGGHNFWPGQEDSLFAEEGSGSGYSVFYPNDFTRLFNGFDAGPTPPPARPGSRPSPGPFDGVSSGGSSGRLANNRNSASPSDVYKWKRGVKR